MYYQGLPARGLQCAAKRLPDLLTNLSIREGRRRLQPGGQTRSFQGSGRRAKSAPSTPLAGIPLPEFSAIEPMVGQWQLTLVNEPHDPPCRFSGTHRILRRNTVVNTGGKVLLKGKAALISGAAAGIGAGIAELFAESGAQVALLDVNGAGAQAKAASIRQKGGQALGYTADVRNREALAFAVEDTVAQFGGVDVLINNAGVYPRHTFLEMTEQQWDEMQDINLKSMFHLAKLVIPHMMRRRAGHIVNISSITFFLGLKNLTHYIASKGGVIGFTRALAREMGEYDIHVNCITPGLIETEGEKALSVPQKEIDTMVGYQCLNRRILPLDIARACLFLSSELSSGVTGQTLNVDGGWVMY